MRSCVVVARRDARRIGACVSRRTLYESSWVAIFGESLEALHDLNAGKREAM